MSQSALGGAPAGVPRRVLDPVLVVWALTLLLGIQPLTTDLYLPALPGMKSELGAPMGAAQLTLSALILAFGFGQLAFGPLADRTGRKPVLLAGLSAYTVAAVGASLAETIDAVIAWRALQGAGMAAAVVCARAMVRDLFPPHEGMRVMSRGMSGLGVIALSSPAVGGLVAAWLGWRAALAVLAIFGAATLAFVLWRLPETITQRNPQATRLGPLLRAWREIAANPTFRAYAGLTFATYAGLYTFLAGSSFVFIEALGLSRTTYGFCVATSSVAYLAGTFACRRWLASHGVRVAVRRAGWCTLIGGLGMAVWNLAFEPSAWSILVPQWFYAFGHGIHQPCGQAGAVGPFPRQAGAASALAGFLLAAGAFAVGAWLGVAMDGSARPVVLTIAFWSVLTALFAWIAVQRHGDPAKA